MEDKQIYGRVTTVTKDDIDPKDETRLVNKGLPKSWTCPHCKKRHTMDVYAEQTLLEHFKVIRQCGRCGYLHLWTLTLTDDFKAGALDMLKNGGKL